MSAGSAIIGACKFDIITLYTFNQQISYRELVNWRSGRAEMGGGRRKKS